MKQRVDTSAIAVLTVTGTFRMRRGEIISPRIFQQSGGALALDDGLRELDWTGAWLGP